MGRIQLSLFSFTLFLSAALMFGLQPMVGKMLLPLVGGTPAGWVVAMAFFQVMLLAGYFFAHLLAQATPRVHAGLYLAGLVVGGVFLPVALSQHAESILGASPGAPEVFLLLSAAVAIPFIALSATASTLQRLFTVSGHHAADDPYFLYAASNLGSFAGLLAYPFFVEPHAALTAQAAGWTLGYGALVLFGLLCLIATGRPQRADAAPAPVATKPLSVRRKLEWGVLALVPSALLVAVTGHITTDIASLPLLWVLPLGLYLLTFVIAFSRYEIVPYEWILRAQPVATAFGVSLVLAANAFAAYAWHAVVVHLLAFFIVALMCHIRLARARPLADEQAHLTAFYLMMSLGGAVGGVLVAFVAPVIFNRMVEYPLLLALTGLLNAHVRSRVSVWYGVGLLGACIALGIFALLHRSGGDSEALEGFLWALSFVLVTLHPRLSVICGTGAFVVITVLSWAQIDARTLRDFYGVIKVHDRTLTLPIHPQPMTVRYMAHGTTLHGYQIMDPSYETTPTTYYTYEGPLGDIVNWVAPHSIAAVGLGTGTISCYARANRPVTFFEIDPAVVTMAKTEFTYLSRCGMGAVPEIVLGDARLELHKHAEKKFDLIVLDAFSSDSVPTHLLTREAVAGYLDRLNPHGVILFHVSNRYFTLEDPIAAVGRALGLENAFVYQRGGPLLEFYAAPSKWIALAAPGVLPMQRLSMTGWEALTVPDTAKVWTDDYTDLMAYLNIPALRRLFP